MIKLIYIDDGGYSRVLKEEGSDNFDAILNRACDELRGMGYTASTFDECREALTYRDYYGIGYGPRMFKVEYS